MVRCPFRSQSKCLSYKYLLWPIGLKQIFPTTIGPHYLHFLHRKSPIHVGSSFVETVIFALEFGSTQNCHEWALLMHYHYTFIFL
ncbi:unnamed protein product, partial [Vitis vinifera]|uniref:Uncharacterized protein n=1 Tax=Vitis vinifera TaxID=29760 RepID=D7TU65_VITVI